MSNLKTIAIYLPQYHRVKENDEWWGEGYTEWTAVKQAEKLYEGHEQPRIPLYNNYYDLMKKETMQWQAELAKKYGVYGFCFFHYYFKDGKKILEKPAENLLEWTDINMPFCFSWVNASWVRTWSKINGGSMASKFEKYEEGNPILLHQTYGVEKDWKEHFEYLLPFFKDKRYIKIDGKPIFLFHIPEEIDCLEKMVECWRNLAKENDLPGIYLIGVIVNSYQEFSMLDALYAHEPRFSFYDYIRYSDLSKKSICNRYNLYEEVCQWSGKRQYFQNQKIYYGTFAGFDSTPRHGTQGAIIDKVTPEIFEKSFKEICKKSILCDNEFVFVNAWNEWGEGNYLEPDIKNKFAFLEKIKKIMQESTTWSIIPELKNQENNVFFEIIKEREFERDKFKDYYHLLEQWMVILENGISFKEYFKKNNYQNLAIYGFGAIGRHFYNQLTGAFDIRYIIDKSVNISSFGIPFYRPDDQLPKVDVIIVTVINEYKQIYFDLKKEFKGDIVSLSEVIDMIL